MRQYLVTAAAGAALVTALLAGPALAAGGVPGPPAGGGTGMGAGEGTGGGTGDGSWAGSGGGTGMGTGMGTGDGSWAGSGGGTGGGTGDGSWAGSGAATGTLSDEQKTHLAAMAEEEKLAHDVYVALYAVNGDVRFSRISQSETRHHERMRTLLARYGVADPTAGKAEGQFTSPEFQQLYRDLVGRGDDSLDAALAVGQDIERLDISDLAKAANGVTASDVLAAYANLSSGSENHLRAFGG
jgi:hypothetical protein